MLCWHTRQHVKSSSCFLPTANLQELSSECGWGGKFNELATKLEQMLHITQLARQANHSFKAAGWAAA